MQYICIPLSLVLLCIILQRCFEIEGVLVNYTLLVLAMPTV